MPGIPPPMPPPIGGIAGSSAGISVIPASVVSSIADAEDAFCSADLVTLARVNDSGTDHVNIFFCRSVESSTFRTFLNLCNNYTSFKAGVFSDLSNRFFQSSYDDSTTSLSIAFQTFYISLNSRDSVYQSSTTTSYDTFLYSSP